MHLLYRIIIDKSIEYELFYHYFLSIRYEQHIVTRRNAGRGKYFFCVQIKRVEGVCIDLK